MLKLVYKIVGLFFLSFIIFIFIVNYSFLSYKESIFIKIYYAIKINIIYYIFYIIYLYFYFRIFYRNKVYKH